MNWITEKENQAADKVREVLDAPLPEFRGEVGMDGTFDPWRIFPSLYGSYSSEFDGLALAVLEDLRDGTHIRDDLANEMLREMLCTANLCDYGTSPRVCFPTEPFKALLPDLIEKWKAYAVLQWGEKTGGD